MKEYKLFLIVLMIILIVMTGALLIITLTRKDCKHNFQSVDGYFDILDYEERLNNEIPLDYSNTPKIHSIEEAKLIAAEIWTDAYDLEIANNNKPYKVYFDFKNNVWLITGSLPKGSLGGVAHLIIDTNGTVLAVWHEK